MADIKISQLGAAIAVSGSDLLPIVSNGSTLKAPASLVKEYAVGNTDLSGIGDGTPTGAISALNTAKQPKTLDTPLTIGDVQKTTVEAALGGLNSESQSLRQALTNVKNGTSDINQTAANGCTIVNGIAKGTYFYLDGVLVKAKTSISNGDSFTSSNYEVPTAGALNDLYVKKGIVTPLVIASNSFTFDVPETGEFGGFINLINNTDGVELGDWIVPVRGESNKISTGVNIGNRTMTVESATKSGRIATITMSSSASMFGFAVMWKL